MEDLDPTAAEHLALALSRVLAQALLQTALARTTGKATYEGAHRPCSGCGKAARFVQYRGRWLRTLCGDQRVTRAYYYCGLGHQGQLPWDEEAGLGERIFSPAVQALVSECCAQLTHTEVEVRLARVLGLTVEESRQQEVVGKWERACGRPRHRRSRPALNNSCPCRPRRTRSWKKRAHQPGSR